MIFMDISLMMKCAINKNQDPMNSKNLSRHMMLEYGHISGS